jgi:uncharacterized protein YceH (UPF0502 family)
VVTNEHLGGRVEKYTQRFCNSRYSHLQFDAPELAIVTLLLLRGAQTPGELRSRSGRLHNFEDNAAVVTALSRLETREPDALVVKLPRSPGRKDSQYMHLFGGPVDVEAMAQAAASEVPPPSGRVSNSELLARIEQLEAEVAQLKAKLAGSSD